MAGWLNQPFACRKGIILSFVGRRLISKIKKNVPTQSFRYHKFATQRPGLLRTSQTWIFPFDVPTFSISEGLRSPILFPLKMFSMRIFSRTPSRPHGLRSGSPSTRSRQFSGRSRIGHSLPIFDVGLVSSPSMAPPASSRLSSGRGMTTVSRSVLRVVSALLTVPPATLTMKVGLGLDIELGDEGRDLSGVTPLCGRHYRGCLSREAGVGRP